MTWIRPRFSIRLGILLVAVIAALLTTGRWITARQRLNLAVASYEHGQRLYLEGRVTAENLSRRSRDLLEAEFAWNSHQKARIRAIQAHLERVEAHLKQARADLRDWPGCRGSGGARIDAVEVEQFADEARTLLAREVGSPLGQD